MHLGSLAVIMNLAKATTESQRSGAVGVEGRWRAREVKVGGGGVTDVQGLCSSGPAGQQPSPTITYAPILDSHIARGNH